MKEFLLIFRADYYSQPKPAPEEFQVIAKQWKEWMESFAAKGRSLESGKRLAFSGKVIKSGNTITDGPYTELKEFLGSYCIITAESLDEAVELAKGCPQIGMGGSVEIREVV